VWKAKVIATDPQSVGACGFGTRKDTGLREKTSSLKKEMSPGAVPSVDVQGAEVAFYQSRR